MFRNTNGNLGMVLRYIFLKNCCKSLGDKVSVQPGVLLFNFHNLSIGKNVSIHPMCYIDAAGHIEIGNNVFIAHCSTLISINHTWKNDKVPIKYNKETFRKIVIEDDVWIGCSVRILTGVRTKSRSVIAAGAVVNKSFDEYSLIGGVPGKLLKRTNEI